MKKPLTLFLFLSINFILQAQNFALQPISLFENIENFTNNSYYEITDFDNNGDLDVTLPMKLDATSLSPAGVYFVTVFEEGIDNVLASGKLLKAK